MIVFRHADSRFPFLWETSDQPAARWHGDGDGPVHYFADTSDGAWAEFLRHEEIRHPSELDGVRRGLWAVEVGEEPGWEPALDERVLHGDADSYPDCRGEADRLRSNRATGLVAPSAALLPGGARGWRVSGGLRPGPDREGTVVVLFGPRPDLVGWAATLDGRPEASLLDRVRHYGSQREDRFGSSRP